MAWSSLKILLLALLMRTSLGQENSTTIEVREEPVNEAKVIADVAAATVFIDSSEIAVIAFFEDLEAPEVEHYNTLVKKHPDWDYGVSSSDNVLKHFKIAGNTVSIFRRVDNRRIDLVVSETKELNTEKLFRFLTINELRMVTEYNPMTAVGVIASKVQIHLLLFMEKGFENQEKILKEFGEAAESLREKVLFLTVDVKMRGNERVMFYFKLKNSDLPKVAIFNSEDETKEVFEEDDITAKNLIDFCDNFLSGESTGEESDKKEVKTEL
ncbi:endoplasmic reticulum resident protein 27 [Discoglossus pictus]